jgi:predicted Fe-Mo cluster-binding NifX family protein
MKRRFAIPTVNGELTAHFGHCEQFAIVETEDNKIGEVTFVTPPVHQPGIYPQFLSNYGVHVIIAGGIGMKAQNLFNQYNIEVYIGVDFGSPEKLVEDFLNNQLQTGQNLCDH